MTVFKKITAVVLAMLLSFTCLSTGMTVKAEETTTDPIPVFTAEMYAVYSSVEGNQRVPHIIYFTADAPNNFSEEELSYSAEELNSNSSFLYGATAFHHGLGALYLLRADGKLFYVDELNRQLEFAADFSGEYFYGMAASGIDGYIVFAGYDGELGYEALMLYDVESGERFSSVALPIYGIAAVTAKAAADGLYYILDEAGTLHEVKVNFETGELLSCQTIGQSAHDAISYGASVSQIYYDGAFVYRTYAGSAGYHTAGDSYLEAFDPRTGKSYELGSFGEGVTVYALNGIFRYQNSTYAHNWIFVEISFTSRSVGYNAVATYYCEHCGSTVKYQLYVGNSKGLGRLVRNYTASIDAQTSPDGLTHTATCGAIPIIPIKPFKDLEPSERIKIDDRIDLKPLRP